MTIREVITELIQKEYDTYELKVLGLLPSVAEGVNRLLPCLAATDPAVLDDSEHFRNWRKEVLLAFYRQLDYAGFLRKEGAGRPFRHFLFRMRKRITDVMRERNEGETIDRELAVPPGTLAFKLSPMLEEELFCNERLGYPAVRMPSEVEELCRKSCGNCFPVSLEGLLARLRKADTAFWDELYLTVKKIARLVTSGQSVSIQYREEISQDTWGDASLLLHDKVVEGDTPLFETPLHFRNYIARICWNKCKEAFRKHHTPDACLLFSDELPESTLSIVEEEKTMLDWEQDSLADVDCENEEEVGRLLSIILWDKQEPWYAKLTKGIEEKTELIFLHYIEGLSYEVIAGMKGAGQSQAEQRRLAAKLRQDVVRTRRVLKERFIGILKNG